MLDNNILYIVIPCYKEEEVLPETARQTKTQEDFCHERKQVHIRRR